jgi:phage baseplate assembly protein W
MVLLDFDLSMKKLFSGAIGVKEDREAIVQSIKMVLLTRKGEKLFDPDYGAGIGDYTEGSISNLDALTISSDIFYALQNELRHIIVVEKNDIIVVANKDKKLYEISIDYKRNDIAEKENVSFSIRSNQSNQ